jgi:hypothetical protein
MSVQHIPHEPRTKPVMLLVLGPHRSGTSLTARMLECLGAANSGNLNPANEYNPKGYFEDLDIYLFNENVLMPALGTSWHAVSPVDWSRLAEPRREELQLRAVELVRKNYDMSHQLSVLKEPRISLLLPFWMEALSRAGFSVKAVCPVRDPLSVARSLAARDPLPLALGCLIYFRAWESVLMHLGETPSAFFDFEEMFTDASATIASIAGQLELPLPAGLSARLHEFTTEHLDPALVHQVAEDEDFECAALGLPRAAAGLYPRLRRCILTRRHAELLQFCQAASAELAELGCYLGTLDDLAARQVMQENAQRHRRARQAALRCDGDGHQARPGAAPGSCGHGQVRLSPAPPSP